MTQAFEPSGRGTNRTFTIYNDLSEEVAVSVTIKGRAVDAEGVETLSDTKDFAIFPQQILLKGKSSQVVRVRWQGASSLTSERSYRITAEEVPLKNSPAQSSGSSTAAIKLILRFGGTIYVASPQARADVVVASARAIKESGGDLLEVILENRGQRHAIIDRPSLSLKAGEATHQIAESDLAKTLAGENILAGGTRRIHLPWPNGLPLGPVEAKLNASFTH
jgi:fimbrial chaperone protein